jgi:quercetin dioxygenase-like cupin family protein
MDGQGPFPGGRPFPGGSPFPGGRLPPWADLRLVLLEPGRRLGYDSAAWRDAVVVVEDGELELEWLSGDRQRLVRGDLLWLCGLPLRALRNPGRSTTVLVAIARRPEPAPPGR